MIGNPINALILYVGGILALVVRTGLRYAETGDTGIRRALRSPIGSAAWWSRLLFAVALLGGIVAPILELTAAITPPPSLSSTAVSVAGTVLAVAGLAGLIAAQAALDDSSRMGVDPEEPTDLVLTGVFAVVRNPVLTCMVVAMVGITLLVPVWPQLLALLCLIAAVQIQVRAVEEPYLLRTHGDAYRRYMARTGRFLPLVGRVRAAGTDRHTEEGSSETDE